MRCNYMPICCALLKHGSSNFALTILEYCLPDKCLIREKHYWDIFKPEYNIAQDPTAPMSGRTHSEKSKIIMSEAKKGENHPNYGKTLPDETKTKISDTAKKSENSGRFKSGQPKIEGSGKPSQVIEVTDIKNNTTTSYNSISEAGRALNINESSIRYHLKSNSKKPFKGQYTLKKI